MNLILDIESFLEFREELSRIDRFFFNYGKYETQQKKKS